MLVPATGTTPAHCRVRGVINRAIRVEVTMPVADWNGRMMFSTVGGGAGMFGDTVSLLPRGFAMATTDTGHEIDDQNYLWQPEALIDYAYRGVHLATQFAKEMITRYYGRDIEYAYLKGCSNGGRAAMLEAIRFPDDYDGIIAGAPAFRFQEMTPWMVGAGRMQQANPLTKESLQLLDDASKTACGGLDGIEDGVIDDPRLCTEDLFDIDTLACTTGQREGCRLGARSRRPDTCTATWWMRTETLSPPV
jgi:feruloyl esterase